MTTQTYTTEEAAKKAAARAYRPAIVRLPNGRFACFQAGDILPRVECWVGLGKNTPGTSNRLQSKGDEEEGRWGVER